MEMFAKMFYMVDPVDDKSTTKEGLDIEDVDEKKKWEDLESIAQVSACLKRGVRRDSV